MFKNKKGFTLIELLAVIALLAIITIIAVTKVIPRGENAKKRAFLDEVKVYYKASDEIDLYDDTSVKCLNISELNDNYVKKDNGNYSGSMYVYPDGSTRLNITNGKYYAITTGDVTINDIVDTKPADFISSCTDNSKSYTITYDLDGGTVSPANPTSYTFNTNTIALNNPTKAGYVFLGWSSKNLINEDNIQPGSIDHTKYSEGSNVGWRRVRFMKCKPNTTYTFSYNRDVNYFQEKMNFYDENGNFISGNNKSADNSNFITATSPANAAFIKVAYRVSSDDKDVDAREMQLEEGSSSTNYQPYQKPSTQVKIYPGTVGNKKYIANWESETKAYSITYDLDGGTLEVPNPASYTRITNSFTLNNPTKSGYRFVGWKGGKNLFNKEETPDTVGRYMKTNGSRTTHADYSIYKAYLKPDTTYVINTSGVSSSPGYALFDSSRALITGAGYATFAQLAFTTPSNVSYILFTVATNENSDRYDKDYFMLEEGMTLSEYEPNVYADTNVTIYKGSYGNRTYTAMWEEL